MVNKVIKTIIILGLGLSSNISPADTSDAPRSSIQVAYRMPGAVTLVADRQVHQSFTLGLIAERKEGSLKFADSYEEMGWNMLGLKGDILITNSNWRLSSFAAWGESGSEKGRQTWIRAASGFVYRWNLPANLHIDAGAGLQANVWESPKTPSAFGSVYPDVRLAAGLSF